MPLANTPRWNVRSLVCPALVALLGFGPVRNVAAREQNAIKATYRKFEYMIPMRDGVRLYASVYVPRNVAGQHPILLERTPYSCGPYGGDRYPGGLPGSPKLQEKGYIFAFEDVRGKFKSEGDYANIRPQLVVHLKPQDIDESTDTYDTIDFLIKNVPDNNGRVGMWGISYPGGYAATGAIDSHPALKAVSPQAPVSDWFIGDDFHHNGAFFLQDAFSFLSWFGRPRPMPSENMIPVFDPGNLNGNAYQYFLDLGPLSNANTRYFKNQCAFWNEMMAHGTYDDYWQTRDHPHEMTNVHCAMMTVGGWFDAEDGWGAIHTYESTGQLNPGIHNALVMGPWFHGMWAYGPGATFGDMDWGSATSEYYRDKIEFPFWEANLRGEGSADQPAAQVFETGTNRWRAFDRWPPPALKPDALYFATDKSLTGTPQEEATPASDSYVSDPAAPTPYQGGKLQERTRSYMIDDQRFAAARPDVLTYETAAMDHDVTIAGPITADLFVATTGTDADFVVKVIDVYPDDAPGKLASYQMMVRGDVMRAKFRDSYQNPKPLTPGKVEHVTYDLLDILHTFKKGHRIMVQVQSSWFPLVDRNPNQFLDIYSAKPEDFIKATIQVYHTRQYPSGIRFGTLPAAE